MYIFYIYLHCLIALLIYESDLFVCISFNLYLLKNYEISKIIYEKGCVQAGEEWMEHNLIIISTSAILTIFFQVCYLLVFFLYQLFIFPKIS